MIDHDTLADLVAFARLEADSGDVEPWADLIRELHTAGTLDIEAALWVTKGYNAHDSFEAGWRLYRTWPTPRHLAADPDLDDLTDAGRYPIMQERRSLRGGRILRHYDSYLSHLAGHDWTQAGWLAIPLRGVTDPAEGFARLAPHLREIWGVGRQTAFEWAEFVAKILDWPVDTVDGLLWESSGPRRALERIFGNDDPTPAWLDDTAQYCKAHLADQGVDLSWWDFETIICDFNVMRGGRYYPGQHIVALRSELDAVDDPDDRALLHAALDRVLPDRWRDIAGDHHHLRPIYRDTGQMVTPLERSITT